MTLDFSPSAQAGPLGRRIRAHAATECRLILRNGEQSLLSLIIPIGILVAGVLLPDRFGQDITVLAPSVFALVVWSTCFTTLAIATGFERRYNVLERLAATPLGKTGILLGKACGIAVAALAQVMVLMVAALLLGWRPGFDVAHAAVAGAAFVLGIVAFCGLALCLAGSQRPEITLALANLFYLAGVLLGLVIPLSSYPSYLQPYLMWLPTAALGEAFRFGTPLALLVLAGWGAVAIAVARKVFRWTS